MSDQTTWYNSDDSSAQQPHDDSPGTTVRRKTAVLLAIGALAIGGVLGGAIGSGVGAANTASAEERTDSIRAQKDKLSNRVIEMKDDLADSEAKIQELENAPALLAEQRKTEEAEAQKKADEEKAAEEAAAKEKAEEEAAAKAEQEKAERTFPGDGTFVVGSDIKAGTYKSDAAPSSFMANCYWARLSGTSGTLGEIISNNNTEGPTTVTIRSTDKAFETSGCTTWERVD